jgi:hypothetical protein
VPEFYFNMSMRPAAAIAINQSTLDWGPFTFDFPIADCAGAPGVIPFGDSLVSAAVTSEFTGTGAGDVSSTANLITPASVTVAGTLVSLRLQYPGDAMAGNHRLVFVLNLASGAKQRLEFAYVQVIKF